MISYEEVGTANSLLQSTSEGNSREYPTYINFKGTSGLALQISTPPPSDYDYSITMWFRAAITREEFISMKSPMYLFSSSDSTKGPTCRVSAEGKLECNTQQQIDLSVISDIQ